MTNKDGSFRVVAIFMVLTMLIAFNWDKWAWMSGAIHSALDPSIGALLNWNLDIGMTIVILLIAVTTTFIQKFTTNQEEMKKLKKEQKALQKKAKELKHDPQKAMAVQKELMPLSMKQMKLGMRTIVYTGVPFVLLFRWFSDFFATPAMEGVKIFGLMGWFWYYLILTVAFSSIIKKKFDIV